MDQEEANRLFEEAAAMEEALDELAENGVSAEGLEAFRRMYPQFKKIWPAGYPNKKEDPS